MAMLDVVYITMEPCDASLGPHAAVGCTREAGDEDVDVARIVLAGLLSTSDAADEEDGVGLGSWRLTHT